MALLVAGRREEALERVDALLPGVEALTTLEQALIGWVLARSGREAEALRIAERLEQRARGGVAWGGARAYLEMGLGRHERALSLLEEAARDHDPNLIYYLPDDPAFDPIRADPRFVRILQRLRGG